MLAVWKALLNTKHLPAPRCRLLSMHLHLSFSFTSWEILSTVLDFKEGGGLMPLDAADWVNLCRTAAPAVPTAAGQTGPQLGWAERSRQVFAQELSGRTGGNIKNQKSCRGAAEVFTGGEWRCSAAQVEPVLCFSMCEEWEVTGHMKLHLTTH